MKVATDSDWAGCKRTRKSTNGGVIWLGNHCIKAWSVTQAALALSSAEAEYYAMVDGVLKAKGIQTLGAELGFKNLDGVIRLGTDSSWYPKFVFVCSIQSFLGSK